MRIFMLSAASADGQHEAALRLLDFALQRSFSVRLADLELQRGENGKPYFVNSGIHFNYSHTDSAVVCAVSDSPVGIDIEKLRQINPRVSERFLSGGDITDWTVREAYGKYTGGGFCEKRSLPYMTRTYKKDGYVITVCNESGIFPDYIEDAEISDVFGG